MNIELVENAFIQHETAFRETSLRLKEAILEGCQMVLETIAGGNTVFFCGNGGSAADAQHLAAEFTGRYSKEREGLPAIALTTDTSALTAIGNDYGYDKVFARQLEALGKKDDLLIAISTSGNSSSVIEAIKKAKDRKLKVLGLSGKGGGAMMNLCDHNIVIPSATTANIQEMHIMIGHIFCAALDASY